MFLLVAAGCSELVDSEKNVETIKIVGSTSMLPLSEKLARQYEKSHENVKIYVQGGDSSLGLKGVAGSIAEIGSLSRPLTAEEKTKFNYYQLTTDNIMVIINPDFPVSHLTLDNIQDIFSGRVKNWQAIGGPDSSISVITREQGSGTYNVFRDIIIGSNTKITEDALVMASTGAVKAAVAMDKYAIGYISSQYLTGEVRPVMIDDGKSKAIVFSRPLIYITGNSPDGTTMGFIKFVLGVEGKAVINEHRI
jgi:phosphate transport system substrate-binding protein